MCNIITNNQINLIIIILRLFLIYSHRKRLNLSKKVCTLYNDNTDM